MIVFCYLKEVFLIMNIGGQFIKTVISVFCAVTISTTLAVSSVGAVTVAPSMGNRQALVAEVHRLNNKLDELSNTLKLFKQRLSDLRKSLFVYNEYGIYIKNQQYLDHIDKIDGYISSFIDFVSVVKGINNVKNEEGVTRLCVFLDTFIETIKTRLALNNFDLLFCIRNVTEDIVGPVGYQNRMRELVNNMIMRRSVLSNNNDVNNNTNLKRVNGYINTIRELIGILGNDKNIKHREAFLGTKNEYRSVADRFKEAFGIDGGGIYYCMTNGRRYKDDINQFTGEYKGNYRILHDLREKFQELMDEYVVNTDSLKQKEFEIKINSLIGSVNRVLDEIQLFVG